MNAIPKVLEVGKAYRFLFNTATVKAVVKEIDEDSGWIAVSVEGVGDYWMNLSGVSGVQTEVEAGKAESRRATAAKDKKS